MKRFLGWLMGLSLLLLPNFVQAFTLSPAIFDVSVDPGAVSAQRVTIANDGSTDQTYYLSIQKFIPSGELGQQQFLPPTETSGLPNWIYVDQPSVKLRAGESRTIPFSIRVPNDAKPGGYYAALFFSTQSPSAAGRVSIAARVGALILLRVNGTVTESVRLQNFQINGATSVSHLPVTFETMMQNDGGIHEKPSGQIVITNLFNMRVATLPLNPDGSRVLPESNRRFLTVWQQNPPTQGRGFFHEVREEWRNFGIGTYTATLTLSMPTIQGGQSSASIHMAVWPWHLALLVMMAGFCLWIVWSWARRKWRAKK